MFPLVDILVQDKSYLKYQSNFLELVGSKQQIEKERNEI
jgi:hypothetical protein